MTEVATKKQRDTLYGALVDLVKDHGIANDHTMKLLSQVADTVQFEGNDDGRPGTASVTQVGGGGSFLIQTAHAGDDSHVVQVGGDVTGGSWRR